jgi:hypothetical protein
MPCNFPNRHYPVPAEGLIPQTSDLAPADRKLVLEANFNPFITQTQALLKSYGRKASQDDLAKILILECIEAGYVTENKMCRVALGSAVKPWYVSTVLHRESGHGGLWQYDDDDRYSTLPAT